MLKEKEVKDLLVAAEKDREDQGPNVTVEINAPLALMQLVSETRIGVYKRILEMK